MSNLPVPPVAKIVPHTFEHLGHLFMDDYAWLQNKEDPQVIAHLEAENAYSEAVLKGIEPLREQLFQELRGRIQEDDCSAPELRGGYFYYWRMQAGKQYRIFCRRQGSMDAPEEILLDENALALGKQYCRVFVFEVSPDHNLLAYSVDTTGARVFDLYIKDLRTGQLLGGPIIDTAYSAAWASDSRMLFYTVFDTSHRSFKCFRHQVDQASKDVMIYHELDDSFFVSVSRSRSGAYLFLNLTSQSTSEVRYLAADQPMGEFKIVHPRQHWLEYYVEHHGDHFLVRTNDQAENFKLVEVPVANPSKENWREVIPHRSDVLVDDIFAFHDDLVVFERKDGLRHIRISAPDGVSQVRYVSFPEPVYTFRPDRNPEFDTRTLRFFFSSMVTPESTIDYQMASGEWQVKKQQQIPSGYDPSQYATERLFATAPDGVHVPISLVYRRGLPRDGSCPLLLTGYGAYGFSNEPDFDSGIVSLLDRGFVFGIAHIRGGSELGRAWYEQGRLMHKKNTFTDFIACAEYLVAQGYTSPHRLAIMGVSAGGLLVSTVTNLRPELFRAVVAEVPFTNMITAMLMPDLPLTVIEYEQWGNPDDPQAFDYMLSYSPYENIEAKAYPSIQAKAGLNDLQVPYWDPAKWIAKLRAYKTNDSTLLLITNMGAGHGGASGRYDHLREDAQIYAFLIDTL